MIEHIPNERLTPRGVPGPDAHKQELADFAESFHGYEVHGSFERVADIAMPLLLDERVDVYAASLTDLRTTLFFVERGAHHQGEITRHDEERMRELVRVIRSKVIRRGKHWQAEED